MVTEARPVRTPVSSRRTCSICPSMRFFTSTNNPFRSLTSMSGLLRPNCRADLLAHDDAAEIAAGAKVEDDDRELVVHAERDCGRVHHLEAFLQDLQVRNLVVLRCVRI